MTTYIEFAWNVYVLVLDIFVRLHVPIGRTTVFSWKTIVRLCVIYNKECKVSTLKQWRRKHVLGPFFQPGFCYGAPSLPYALFHYRWTEIYNHYNH
jgi:hypothetical protein